MKKMLTFCEKCGNVMVLKEKEGRSIGHYQCRTCGLVKKMKLNRIELKEKIIQEPQATLVPERLKFPLKF